MALRLKKKDICALSLQELLQLPAKKLLKILASQNISRQSAVEKTDLAFMVFESAERESERSEREERKENTENFSLMVFYYYFVVLGGKKKDF